MYLTQRNSNLEDAVKAYKITSFFGESSKRFPIQMILAALTTHFIKLLRYHGATMQNLPKSEIASIIGVNPYFLTEYSTAAKNYPLNNCVRVISLLREYDYKSKSNMRGNATDGELLFELISKILN
jgi:DNA polymerase-3 subunit delta